MQLLLDTHALLWWLLNDPALSGVAEDAMRDADNEVFVSAASAWEISTKFRLGKLPTARALVTGMDAIVRREGFLELPVSISHGESAGSLPMLHKDPFDRMLIAQALANNFVLVSNEAIFDVYGAARLW